jgi:Cu(I)/Ag(I) efflux system periplasmic protein CusF
VKLNTSYLVPLVFLVLSVIPAVAEDANNIMPMDGRAPTQSYRGLGTINNVNVKAGRINLSHGPIASLGLKAMITNFDVVDRALLAHLKKGQRIAFSLVEARKGQYAISEITVVK